MVNVGEVCLAQHEDGSCRGAVGLPHLLDVSVRLLVLLDVGQKILTLKYSRQG